MTVDQAVRPETITAPRERRPARKRLKTLSTTDKVVLGMMVGIPTLIEACLIWLPSLASIGLSFGRWDGIGSPTNITSAGISNYTYIFTNYPSFWPAVLHNLIWLVFLAVIATPLGVLLAVLLDRKIRFTRIYQSIFFLPVMLSLALIGIIWQLIYSSDNGLIDSLLGIAGKPQSIDFFGDKSINLWAALVAQTWRHAGYVMILYLAGLKGVDLSLKEAAALDGATALQTFTRIVFPVMKPINTVVIVITIIEALRSFDLVYIINGGTNGLELLSALVVRNLQGEGQDLGVGSAIATVLLVLSLVPIIIYLSRTFRKDRIE
ncbi:MAG: multiple sugar transport system permease protein [Actinomycetota bacterium]|jgi:multiple sugar transport system permease protein/raffinose/stachyose/melibiose transport system permease protein|nr:multiple sugar transport system permease protein [Actinomycetota bacterium]